MPSSVRRALAFGFAFFVILSALAVAAQPAGRSHAQAGDHPIVTVAKQYLGTYQGDCWPFVKKVVLEATGGQMGFGYIQAFLDAGGYEVPISEARNGDIVQIVDDDDAGPGADHPGLHTAIIVEVNADGTFLAIDSNQKWDGIVRWRPNYDPELRAAQMGINVHVFRFGDSGGGGDDGGDDGGDGGGGGGDDGEGDDGGDGGGGGGGGPAPIPTPDGSPAIVSADGEGLRLRSAPSLNASIITTVPDGTTVWMVGPLVQGDGVWWAPVKTLGWGDGWMAEQYLQRVGEELPTPPPGPGGAGEDGLFRLGIAGVGAGTGLD